MKCGWKYAGASVVGTSHLRSQGGVCQDFHRCSFIESLDVLVCVVSDGAGSASRSEEGARLTCDLVTERAGAATFAEIFTRNFATGTLARIQETLANSAHVSGQQLRDYACTLLVAIAGREKISFWQIGDGAICFRERPEEELHFAFWPAKGEYANITEFVTDANAESELEFDAGEMRVEDLALFSDGLERLALDFTKGEVHSPFFSSLFPHLYRRPEGHLKDIEEQMTIFLGSKRVNSNTDDDKTLILATRTSDAA